MSLGRGRLGLSGPLSGSGGVDVDLPVTATPGSNSILIEIGAPANGTLQDWDLYVKGPTDEDWVLVEAGLVGDSRSISGRDPETAYQWRVVGHVLVDGETTGTATTLPTPPGVTAWRYHSAGAMYIKGATLSTQRYTYTWRFTNPDSEAASEILLDFGAVYATATTIVSLAYSFGGTNYAPGPDGWAFATFDESAATSLGWNDTGSVSNPDLHTARIPAPEGGWDPGGSIIVRLVVEPGLYNYSSGGDAEEINWPSIGKRATGDYGSTLELLAQSPSWSTADYSTAWYSMRLKRTTATPMIIIHGDSVAAGVRATGSTNENSGYNYCMRLNELTDEWQIVSMGHGGTTMTTSEQRLPEILAMHTEATHIIAQSWSGNSSPTSIAGCDIVKAAIIAMETATLEAGKKFWVATLKPHGGTISTAGEIEAYYHMVDWCTERYGIKHFDLSLHPSLTADGGLTLLNSEDNTHFNGTGQYQQALALKPLIDAALVAEGYTITA